MKSEIPKENLEAILVSMVSAIKNTELYPAEHPSVQKPLTHTYEILSDLLRTQGTLSLGIVEEVLVFEGIPFYSGQPAIKELQKRFEEREISMIEIHDGMTSLELSTFAKMLAESPDELKSAGALSQVLHDRGIEHIVIKDAKEVYNNALQAVGEVLQEARMGRIPRAGKAKAAVSDLKRMVLNDRPALLALTLIKTYDDYLFNHSVNVSIIALSLAQGLKVPEDDQSDIGVAGLLHDVGKTMIPKSVILKPGALNVEEWDLMRQHPTKSAEVVKQMDGMSELVVRMVIEHHVHFDLNGYPELEPGQHPHPYSKIITVADCYDAITTLRPYQKPLPSREAMQIMERLSGKVIDPKYFEEFVKMLGIYPVGTLVRLDTNEVAVVAETFSQTPLSPRIRIVFDPEGRPLTRPIELDLSSADTGSREFRSIVSTVDPILYNVDPETFI